MNELAPQTQPKAPNVLLLGEMGSGKTHAIRSMVAQGIEVFLLSTEPGFEDVLGDIPADKLHWHYVPAYTPGPQDVEGHTFDNLLDAARLVNTTHFDAIQKMGGVHKERYPQFFEIVKACNNFVDDRTGQTYGDVAFWPNTRCLFLDSLSGVKEMVIRNTIGDKPFMELRDYTAVQYQIRQLINGLCYRTNAWFVLTAHLERETDPNTGAYKLMVSVPGKALAPELPRFFSDSILCRQTVSNGKSVWTWETLSTEVTVKSRNLPLAQGLAPDFGLLVSNWRKRVGITS